MGVGGQELYFQRWRPEVQPASAVIVRFSGVFAHSVKNKSLSLCRAIIEIYSPRLANGDRYRERKLWIMSIY